MNDIKFIYNLLTNKNKIEAMVFLFAIFGLSLFELAGIVGFLPFLSVLSNPEVIESNK